MKVFFVLFVVFSVIFHTMGSFIMTYKDTKKHGCVGDVCGDMCFFSDQYIIPKTTYKFDGGQFECKEDFSVEA